LAAVDAAAILRDVLRTQNSPLQINPETIQYVAELDARLRIEQRGVQAITTIQLERLIRSLDTSKPHPLRLKALALLLWSTWCRISELLRRTYPNDVRVSGRRGIVIAINRSKTNIGCKPELIFIPHTHEIDLCAVCALRAWLDWLGPAYVGPLFPFVSQGVPTGMPLDCDRFNIQLSIALRRAGISDHLTSYAFRRGGATAAASNGVPFDQIAAKLRHRSFSSSVDYIDVNALFQLMANTVE
jgi:integrase